MWLLENQYPLKYDLIAYVKYVITCSWGNFKKFKVVRTVTTVLLINKADLKEEKHKSVF